MDSPGDPAAGQARGYDVARGHEGPGHLYSDFDVGNVVLIEHDIVPVGAEVAVAEEGPDLVEHFFPQRREPLPGGGRGHNGGRTFGSGSQLDLILHRAVDGTAVTLTVRKRDEFRRSRRRYPRRTGIFTPRAAPHAAEQAHD